MARNSGQGMIESLLILPVMTLAFMTILFLIYWGLIYFYSSARLEEALLCAAHMEVPSFCQSSYRRNITSVLLFREPVSLRISKSSQQVQAFLEIDFLSTHRQVQMHISRTLRLPLEANIR